MLARKVFTGSVAFVAALLFNVVPAMAATAYNGVQFTNTGYDYAPATVDSGGTRKIWWCGYGIPPGASIATDVIYYRTQNLSTHTFSSIQMVLWPNLGSADWDARYTCDPSVVSGDFVDPNTSTHYSLALYYTGSSITSGLDAKVGVAFSNDGVNWVRPTTSPVITAASPSSLLYGAGQPSAYNSNASGASVRVSYVDNTTMAGNRYFTATSSDGLTFGSSTIIQNNGLGTTAGGNATDIRKLDAAWDSGTSYWYAAIQTDEEARMGELSYGIGVYRAASLTSGSWEPLGFISTDTTGQTLNHNPGLVRGPQGNLLSTSSVEVLFATGTTTPTTWDLADAIVTPGVSMALNQYYDGSDFWATSGYHSTSPFHAYIGAVLPAWISGTHPLITCVAGSDNFIAFADSCEGQYALGVTGYAYDTQVSGTHPVYRCYTGSNNFLSLDADCGIATPPLVTLGYIPY